jgi:GNAT superfamily N-acetyltransferase
MDDLPAWSILCFYIHAKHRGQGVARALLDAAIPFAAERGAPVLEAYPHLVDAPITDGSLFVGTLSMFLDAGFEEVVRPQPHRAYVRRKL